MMLNQGWRFLPAPKARQSFKRAEGVCGWFFLFFYPVFEAKP